MNIMFCSAVVVVVGFVKKEKSRENWREKKLGKPISHKKRIRRSLTREASFYKVLATCFAITSQSIMEITFLQSDKTCIVYYNLLPLDFYKGAV